LTQHRPKILALGYACNVTGVIHPIRALCALARARGVMTVVDAAQAIPHIPVSVHELGCDFLAFSAHKMLGPTGLGILAARRDGLESLDPLLVGGGTVERVTSTGYTLKKIPHRFEAGTPHISGVLGLAAAIDYLEQLGFDAIIDHERKLAAAIARVLSRIPHLRVFMATEHPRLAVASFAVCGERVTPDHLARVLSDSYQIMVRSGFHCAHPFFDRHAAPQGALRISAYLYNTEAEIEHFGEVLMVLVQRLVGA
jgi:cysteine desulfurase/selenocysteine lyase